MWGSNKRSILYHKTKSASSQETIPTQIKLKTAIESLQNLQIWAYLAWYLSPMES